MPGPKRDIDWRDPTNQTILASLARAGASNREIAAAFQMTEQAIKNLLCENISPNDHAAIFRAVYEESYCEGNVALRRAQMRLAEDGNAPMLIWLGKNRLEQTDKFEQTSKISLKMDKERKATLARIKERLAEEVNARARRTHD